MNFKNIMPGILALTLIVGCVQTSATMLDDRRAIIAARGNAFTESTQVLQETLLAAAKLTKERGFDKFAILGSQDQTQTGMFYQPGTTYSSGYATGTASTFGNNTYGSANYSGSAWSTPGMATPIVKPGVDVVIYMFRTGEDGPQQAWDANSVLANAPQK